MSRRVLIALSAVLIGGLAFVGFSGATFTDTSRTTTSATAAPDWTPPVVQLADPGYLVVGTVDITATVYDEISAVQSVEIQYAPQGGSWSTLCTTFSDPYTCAWDTESDYDGDYTLRAIAVDSEGNSATSAVVYTTVDNRGRRVDLETIPSPVSGSITMAAQFYNSRGRTVTMQFQYFSAGQVWTDIPGCGPADGDYQTCTVNTANIADGGYDLRVTALWRNRTTYVDGQDAVTFDNTRPSVTIDQAADQIDPSGESAIRYTVVFSEAVTGFDSGDVVLSGTGLTGSSTATVTGFGSTYEVEVTQTGRSGTVIADIPADGALDLAGNGNTASTSTDNVVTRETVPPTVTVEQAVGQSDPTNGSAVAFTVTFSEPVTGFDASDVTLSGTATGSLQAAVSGSGPTYDVTVIGMSGDGTVVVDVPADTTTDLAGNANQASTSLDNSVTWDSAAPSVTVEQAAGQVDPERLAPINFTVEFSEPVTGFTAADVTTTSGNPSVSGSGTTYTVSVTGMAQGELSVSVPAGGALDLAGNANTASTSLDNTVIFDNVRPRVTINQAADQADPTNTAPIYYTVVFDEPVSGFLSNDIGFNAQTTTPGARTVTVLPSSDGMTYTIAVSGMTGSGNVVPILNGGRTTDAAGNTNTAASFTDRVVTFDTTIPTVTIEQSAGQADPTNGSPISFTVVFSKPVTGFETGDVTLSGTSGGPQLATVSGSGTTYDVAVTGMSGDGTVIAELGAGAAQDTAGNDNAASTSTDNSVRFDAVAPTVTINQASGQADPTNGSTIDFTVVFSEPVTGFETGDVSLSGTAGGPLAGTVTGSGTTYNVAVTGMGGNGTVIATIAGAMATDAAGNDNTASTSTDNTVTLDIVAPTVTIDQASGQADPTNGSTIDFTVVFSEPVTGFVTDDVTLSGTAAGSLTGSVTGSGTTYNVAVTGMADDGTVEASLDADMAMDAAGNGNEPSTSADNEVTYDATPPTVTIKQSSGQADPTNGSTINFTVVFSEPVTGFTTGDVTLGGTTGGTKVGTVTGSGTTYNVAVTGMTGQGTVVASISGGMATDVAGNSNAASTSTDNTVTRDTVGPSVTINQASGQADPTNGSTINFTVVFSEPVTGFTTGDVTLSGTTGGTKVGTVTGSGTTYDVAVTGMTGQGTVVATIAGAVANDAAGNNNAASTSTDNTVTRDTVSPTVTINQASGQADPTKTSPINFTVIFSEAVTDFTTGDVTIGGTSSGTKVGMVTGSGTTYNVAVSGMTGSGTVIASVPAAAATDAAGNGNAASTSTDNTVTLDTVAPS